MIQLIEQIKNKIRLIVGRALIESVNSANGEEGLSIDIALAGGEKHSRVPLMQQYGITSRPKKNAEAVILFIGGARDNGIAVATMGNETPTIEDGEVLLFSEFGQKILLKKDGSIVAKPKSGKAFRIESNVEATGQVTAFCDTTKVSLSTHIHPTPVGPTSVPNPNS